MQTKIVAYIIKTDLPYDPIFKWNGNFKLKTQIKIQVWKIGRNFGQIPST